MHTSNEQIRETYAASEREDFATVAAKLTMDIDETSDMSDTDTEEDFEIYHALHIMSLTTVFTLRILSVKCVCCFCYVIRSSRTM